MSRRKLARDWSERVRDILNAIAEIDAFVAGHDRAAFTRDARTVKAVLADFAIIGEAARHVPEDVCIAHPDVPWRQMRDMRNIVVHAYFAVEPSIVWDTIVNDLPKLRASLQELLEGDER